MSLERLAERGTRAVARLVDSSEGATLGSGTGGSNAGIFFWGCSSGAMLDEADPEKYSF